MEKDNLFLKDEAEANRGMALGCLFTGVLLLILWICYLVGVFPIRDKTLIMFTFPINIILLAVPFCLVKTKLLYHKHFKYFVLALFAIVISLINVVIPKHGILGWAALIALASYYHSPKIIYIFTGITLVLMASSLFIGMLMGEWDSNLMGISDLDFDQWTINGHPGDPNSLDDRLWVLIHYKEMPGREGSTDRFLSAYLFYFNARAITIILISLITSLLCKRNKNLLKEEANVLTEKNKIDADLNVAQNIQLQALPREFPEVEEYDVYALMRAAKEVGGDFYDVYKPGPTRLCFSVGDVSGKGVPAALFMMKAKTLIKTLSCAGQTVNKVLEHSNFELNNGNDQGMFVTALTGILDLKGGHLTMANAGHNPPLIRHFGGKFEYLQLPKGFVLGGLEGSTYETFEQVIQPGDTLFLYTDGVTEAMNENNELYGEERLLNFLNSLNTKCSAKDICEETLADVKKFAGDAPQADDITMFSLIYVGPDANEIVVDSTTENVDVVTDYIFNKLSDKNIDKKIIAQINVAVDEIYSNIARYAYGKEIGKVSVQVRFFEEYIAITFIDNGVEFNPLERESPDVTLSAEDRDIGGLGIFIVKQTMDKVLYNYIDNQNMLTIAKAIK